MHLNAEQRKTISEVFKTAAGRVYMLHQPYLKIMAWWITGEDRLTASDLIRLPVYDTWLLPSGVSSVHAHLEATTLLEDLLLDSAFIAQLESAGVDDDQRRGHFWGCIGAAFGENGTPPVPRHPLLLAPLHRRMRLPQGPHPAQQDGQ